jgi:hypothetical protein
MLIFLLANQRKDRILLTYGTRLLCGFLQAAGYEPAACSFYAPAAAGFGLIPPTLLLVSLDAVLLPQIGHCDHKPLPLTQ